MQKRSQSAWLVGTLGMALMLAPGCSKQIDTKSGSAELEGGAAKQKEAARDKQAEEKRSAQAPPSEPAGPADRGNGPLKGFEPVARGNAASEERVSEGTMVAKAEPSESARRQAEEMGKEQAATALAGLKDVFFAFDSWKITEEGRQALSFDAQWLKDHPDKRVTVEGHCDERGTQSYNLVLGEKRAKAVRAYLAELGVDANRLGTASLGKEQPFCREHAEVCYQQNRRVHVVLRGQ